MPILYKGNERVLFAHIPKTAGTSLYVWFVENGWLIANLNLLSTMGVGLELRRRFNIKQCQLEGELPRDVSPQHATREYFAHWGEFTSSFCLVREPLKRYASELGYLFPTFCKRNNITKPTKAHAIKFADLFFKQFKDKIGADSSDLDNHLRPQVHFIKDGMDIYELTGDWCARLKERYGLTGMPPVLNRSPEEFNFLPLLDNQKRAVILRRYSADCSLVNRL